MSDETQQKLGDTYECRCGARHRQERRYDERLGGEYFVSFPPLNWTITITDENGNHLASGGGGACSWEEMRAQIHDAYSPETAAELAELKAQSSE